MPSTENYERMLARAWKANADALELAEVACRWNHRRRLKLAMTLCEECQGDVTDSLRRQAGIPRVAPERRPDPVR